jgi:hypothetical protein
MPPANERPRRVAARDRAAAWVLTGPVGRLAAFAGDLGAAWLRWAAGKVRGS